MFFLTFFLLGSSGFTTCSDTCSGASHLWADFEVGFWAVWGAVLVDVEEDCFLLPQLSIVLSGKGNIMEVPEPRVLGLGKGTLRGTEK